MTKRSLLLPLAALAVLAACGKTDSPETAADSVLAAAPPAPQIPHVVGFNLGRQADSSGRISGGTGDLFKVSDTIFVSVRTQYTKAGDVLSLRLRQGDRTLDSTSVTLEAPDSTGFVVVPLRFSKATNRAAGRYEVEALLGTASQGIREITLSN
jgi:hypothetical protein